MPIEVQWGNTDRTVIHYSPTGSWTWAEYFEKDAELKAMLDSIDYPVAILYDTRGLKVPPDLFSHYQELRKETGLVHPNSAVSVVVVSNRLWLKIVQSFLSLFKVDGPRHYFVGTREEAEELIARLGTSEGMQDS